MPKYLDVHPEFRMNGRSLNRDKLTKIANGYIKKGRDFELIIGEFLLDWFSPDDKLVVQTSGSTGIPKQIQLQKGHMVNSALATGIFFNLSPGKTALHCLSANFIAGKMMLVRAMVLGLHIDVVPPNGTPLISNTKSYDFGAMVPLQLQNSLSYIDRFKFLLIGGAPISKSLKNQIQNNSAHVFESYGMTETVTHIAIKRVNNFDSNDLKSNNQKESTFKTLPDVTVSKDKRDCLVINAPKVSDQKIITNDIVQLISPTEFKWLGRYDNIINSGGVKLIPERIEAILSSVLTHRLFVTGILDDKLGQKLVLFIEGDSAKTTILQHIDSISNFNRFWKPKEIRIVKQFQETKTGKIDRSKTIDAYNKAVG